MFKYLFFIGFTSLGLQARAASAEISCVTGTHAILAQAFAATETAPAQAAAKVTAAAETPAEFVPTASQIRQALTDFETQIQTRVLLNANATPVALVPSEEQAADLLLIQHLRGQTVASFKADYLKTVADFGDINKSIVFLGFVTQQKLDLTSSLEWIRFLSQDLDIPQQAAFGINQRSTLPRPKFAEALASLQMIAANKYTPATLQADAQKIGEMFSLTTYRDFLDVVGLNKLGGISLEDLRLELEGLQKALVFYQQPFGLARNAAPYTLNFADAMQIFKLSLTQQIPTGELPRILLSLQKETPYATLIELADKLSTLKGANVNLDLLK